MKKLLLIGAGNMARALWSKQWATTFQLTVYTPSGDSAKKFVQQFGGVAKNIDEIKGDFDYLFLACKPQQVEDVAQQFREFCTEKTLIISILASIEVVQLQTIFGVKSVLRLMPNTPAKVQLGTITYFSNEEDLVKPILTLLKNSSTLVPLRSEEEIDITTPVSGSGPAFLFELARIWQLYLEQHGISPTIAKELISSTFVGSAALMQHSTESFQQLRQEVTSKAGVTERGLATLSTRDFEQTVLQSLEDALMRIAELRG